MLWGRFHRKSMQLTISPYDHGFREAVHSLIATIQQQEFLLPIRLEDQPDLLDIERHYQFSNGNFWIALADDTVVGTIGLLDIGNRQFALRKMFVSREFRGRERGVASALLHTAHQWARQLGYRSIFLGTTDRFMAAHRFYEKNGYSLIDVYGLPQAFPRMPVDNVFYAKNL